jgi:hypothetical protein
MENGSTHTLSPRAISSHQFPFSVFHFPGLQMSTFQPTASGEEWLGRNAPKKRRLWEQLNPRHRKLLRVLATALALRQSKAHLPEPVRARLLAALDDLEHLATHVERLLNQPGVSSGAKAPLNRPPLRHG